MLTLQACFLHWHIGVRIRTYVWLCLSPWKVKFQEIDGFLISTAWARKHGENYFFSRLLVQPDGHLERAWYPARIGQASVGQPGGLRRWCNDPEHARVDFFKSQTRQSCLRVGHCWKLQSTVLFQIARTSTLKSISIMNLQCMTLHTTTNWCSVTRFSVMLVLFRYCGQQANHAMWTLHYGKNNTCVWIREFTKLGMEISARSADSGSIG